MTRYAPDDYFYCDASDCPGEHPIPGMTCPSDEDAPDEDETDDLPVWCAGPDDCTDPTHRPVSRNSRHRSNVPADLDPLVKCGPHNGGWPLRWCPRHFPELYATDDAKHRADR